MIAALEVSGLALIALAGVHVVFPRYFRWAEELQRLSLVNAEMMRIHTLFVAVTVAGMGLLSVLEAEAMATTPFGKTVAAGFALFWGLRLVVQHVGYSASLWRGKTFETVVHVAFTLLWAWLTGLYAYVALGL